MFEQMFDYLQVLVFFDICNLLCVIIIGGIFDYLCVNLFGFNVEVIDYGVGVVSLYVVCGMLKYLFNVYLDIVLDLLYWSVDLYVMCCLDDCVVGLGVCDIKGVVVVLVVVVNVSDGDVVFLFFSDEEVNDLCCIVVFLVCGLLYEVVFVVELIMSEVVLVYCGISLVLMQFVGCVGYVLGKQDVVVSVLYQVMCWGNCVLDYVELLVLVCFGGLIGLCFNIGCVEGGIKVNMIVLVVEVCFGFCLLLLMDIDGLLVIFVGFVELEVVVFIEMFCGFSLFVGDIVEVENCCLLVCDVVDVLELLIGNVVDFWIEVLLFLVVGYIILVFGLGDIVQVYIVDEFVMLDQLQCYIYVVYWIIVVGV